MKREMNTLDSIAVDDWLRQWFSPTPSQPRAIDQKDEHNEDGGPVSGDESLSIKRGNVEEWLAGKSSLSESAQYQGHSSSSR